MDHVEVQRFVAGPVPEPECRDVPASQLAEGECDWQTSFGMPAGITYCGAPRWQEFRYCRHHAFDALINGDR